MPDVLRYGDYSRLGESIYDHPYQWGSKRTGPDLARVGGKYPNIWHLRHMEDPRTVSIGSNMPNYPWLLTKDTDLAALPSKIAVQRTLGIPYPNWTPEQIAKRVNEQAKSISADLRTAGRLRCAREGNHRPDRLPATSRKIRGCASCRSEQPVAASIEANLRS